MIYFYALIAILVIALIVIALELIYRSKLRADQIAAVRTFQEDHHLSSRDLKIFKEVLQEAKEQIIAAESALNKVPTPDPIIPSALNASKEIFMYLMDEPKEIITFGDFLYRNLPAFSSTIDRLQKLQNAGIETVDISKSSQALNHIMSELSHMIIADFETISKGHVEESSAENVAAKK